MAMRQPAMALIGIHIGGGGAERLPPGNGVALVAGVAVEHRAGDVGNMMGDHVGIAAEARAGENERGAANRLARAIRAGDDDGGNAAVGIGDKIGGGGIGQYVDTGGRAGGLQRRHQFLAGAVGGAHHPHDAVAGVEKAGDEAEGHAVRVAQPGDGGG